MFLFLMIKKPFTENALNCANIVTELGLCLVFPIISIFLFDISSKTRERIDIFLIVLVNIMIGSQMLASLYTTSKVVIKKIKNRKSSKIVPENTKEQNKQMKILISHSEKDKNDNFSFQNINVSPQNSCEASMLCDESDEKDKKVSISKKT